MTRRVWSSTAPTSAGSAPGSPTSTARPRTPDWWRLPGLGKELGFDVDVRETNDEGELIRWLHEAADGAIPVVLNPGAFTHYSYGMRDAAAQRTAPLIEVHISNPYAREEFRHTSVVAAVASGTSPDSASAPTGSRCAPSPRN